MIYLVTSNPKLMVENSTYSCITKEESLLKLQDLKIIGVDTETSGLDCHKDKLLSLQLGNFNFQIVIDCLTVDISFYKDYLQSDSLFLFWNAKFDLKWLFTKQIVPINVYDGFLAEKLMWLGYPAGMHSMSLKSAGLHYLNIELDKSVRGKIIWQGLTEETINYAALDVKYLEYIMDEQRKELKKKDLLKAIDVENHFVLPLAYMEFCGIKLDIDRWKTKMSKDSERLSLAEKALNNFIIQNYDNKSPFINILQPTLFDTEFILKKECSINWNSPNQVIPLFRELGFNLQVKDKKTGLFKDSVEAKVIEPQKDLSPIASLYLEYKAAQKVCSTYGQNFLDQINPNTGRIYTNYNSIGTDTARISSGGRDGKIEYINFLNIPADAETRACFIAEEGNKWISRDYNGQESMLMASIANDPLMLDEINNGSGDIHSLVAKLVFSKEIGDTSTKEIKKKFHKLRQEAKGYEFN